MLDKFATRCSCTESSQQALSSGRQNPQYCNVHGEYDPAGAQNFTELADSTTLIYRQRLHHDDDDGDDEGSFSGEYGRQRQQRRDDDMILSNESSEEGVYH